MIITWLSSNLKMFTKYYFAFQAKLDQIQSQETSFKVKTIIKLHLYIINIDGNFDCQ